MFCALSSYYMYLYTHFPVGQLAIAVTIRGYIRTLYIPVRAICESPPPYLLLTRSDTSFTAFNPDFRGFGMTEKL